MPNLKKILYIIFFSIVLMSCEEKSAYTEKKNLNNILNKLSSGNFYSCNLINKNKKIKSTLNFIPNNNVTLIYTENIIGLIYDEDKWNYGNSIFIKDIKNLYKYNLGDSYSEKDFNKKIIQKNSVLKFQNNILSVDIFKESIQSQYTCVELKKILSEAMKKEIVKNFLFQKNKDKT